MEISQHNKCPSDIIDVITDINCLKYFLNAGYEPSPWAPVNQMEEKDGFEERFELLLNYPSIVENYEGFQWLFIDDFKESHLPILSKMVEKCPAWLDTEHGWNYKYTLLQRKNGHAKNLIYLNHKLMTNWEKYEDYDIDEDDKVQEDDEYIELDELLSTITPNEDTVRICGKNTCLPYHAIRKVFEKCDFSSKKMKEAFEDFKNDIDDNFTMSVKEGLSELIVLVESKRNKRRRVVKKSKH